MELRVDPHADLHLIGVPVLLHVPATIVEDVLVEGAEPEEARDLPQARVEVCVPAPQQIVDMNAHQPLGRPHVPSA